MKIIKEIMRTVPILFDGLMDSVYCQLQRMVYIGER